MPAHGPLFVALTLVGLAAGVPARASFRAVDFSASHNHRIQNNGGNAAQYPAGSLTLGGVAFETPTTGLNAWHAHVAADGGDEPVVQDFPVRLRGVTRVYTLINNYWGQDQAAGSFAQLEFMGSAGAMFTRPLLGNVDIRDFLRNTFTNAIASPDTVNVFSSSGGFGSQVRLDMQIVDLPAAFHTQTLEAVRITDTGGAGVQRVWLAGLTVESPRTADFDQDGDVDGEDFLIWQRGFGIAAAADLGDGDADGDRDVDGDDFLAWQLEFEADRADSRGATIPEPAALLLVASGAVAGLCRRRRRHRARSPRQPLTSRPGPRHRAPM